MRSHAHIAPAAGQKPASTSGILQRSCSCGRPAGPTGECAECRKKRGLRIQRKLRVSDPGDRYEREADRISRNVLASTEVPRSPVRISGIASHAGTNIPPTDLIAVLAEPCRPLDARTRREMESRLGYDFASVRIHHSERADRSAMLLNARAFTAGNHIVFSRRNFKPGTTEGRRLLAHELVHVVQQQGGSYARNTATSDAQSPTHHVSRTRSAEAVVATHVAAGGVIQRAAPLAAAGAAAVAVGRVLLACIIGAAVSFGLERYVIGPVTEWIFGDDRDERERKCRELIASIIGCVSGGLGSVAYRWFLREAGVTGRIAETFLERAILWLLVKGVTVPSSVIAGLTKMGCVRPGFIDEARSSE